MFLLITKNDEDLYYMQGYITAKFRLLANGNTNAQCPQGRVSEVVGEKALDNWP